MKQKNLLEKGIEVFEKLKEENFMTFVQLQRKLNIPKTTLYRILKTLIDKNFVIYQDKKYKLGYSFLSYANKILSEIQLREITSPYLKELCKKTGETIELIIPYNDEILYIDKIESPQSIKLVAQIGSKYKTLHASAPGKILLAYDEGVFKNFMSKKKLKKITPKTITNKGKLIEEIEKIKKEGWAYDIGEARIDVIRIAAPIFDYDGEIIGIISIAGPSYRIKREKIKNFGKILKGVCYEISKKIGYEKGGGR
ncbi:MAG: IclR family transcriptional regulator [Candidatus Omnitrophica bacterium]|nr:IclR family transcriptional regulator [Candidatus Omnitrophota bacterium]